MLRRLAALVRRHDRAPTIYQTGARTAAPKPYISFKVASRELADLPAPKPYREIFVWPRRMSRACTCASARWRAAACAGRDRRDDFRTEVLGLVKAQQVKNAVIVPVGSKGGFYPKQLPRGGAPEAIRAEAVRGLQDLPVRPAGPHRQPSTPRARSIHPAGVVVHDGDDPYLVVAADKGTATFSDIANGVAEDYGFWLGDAFASGGSAGYDHKAMGITARGAWEAVKRHFRELGKDIQTEPVHRGRRRRHVGRRVRQRHAAVARRSGCVAAFDHRHIFLDPDPGRRPRPGPSASGCSTCRARPGTTTTRALISKGGGVFPRTLKSIPLVGRGQGPAGREGRRA